jgi:hypothetical protein
LALDRPLSLQLESKFDEELGCGRKVVNHDADVLHPLDRHVLDGNESRLATTPGAGKDALQQKSRPRAPLRAHRYWP